MKNSIFLLVLLFLALSININSQWVHSSSGMHDLRIYSLAANNTKIFAGTPQSLSVSTNNGVSWYLTSFNSQLEPVHSLSVNGINIYAGVQGYGVTVSPNNGGYWTFHHPLGNRIIYALTYSGGIVFAAASAMSPGSGVAGVYFSVDNGYSFTQTSLINKTILSLAANGNNLFAGANNEGVYLTTNNGVNWSQTSLNNQTVQSLAVSGNFIFAGTISNGVYISSNNGASWVQSSLNNQTIYALAVSGNNVFAGTSSPSSFFASNNNGTTWTQRNEGLTNVLVDAICIINDYIFAGTTTNGVYRRPLSELVGINPISSEIPNEYNLSQNYPNPFNPTTHVKFQIPKSGFVGLKIYDAIGKEIATLVNEQLNPGAYEVNWDALAYPSGVFYYKLIAGDFNETKKMILIK